MIGNSTVADTHGDRENKGATQVFHFSVSWLIVATKGQAKQLQSKKDVVPRVQAPRG